MQLLDGKATARQIQQELKEKVEVLRQTGKKVPHLAAVLVGNDPASQAYVRGKVKDCERVGFGSSLIRMEESVGEDDLLQKVAELNADEDIDGFIVQLPLPRHINVTKIIEAIDYKKDVDGFHPVNVGRMTLNLPCFLPATPYGILELLKRHGIETSGKKCVIIGRSNIVGRPMSILMSRSAEPGNCTVTLCHSRTSNLLAETGKADILIAALGSPGFVKADHVKEGAVVIDVGISRVEDDSEKGYALKGDVDFENVAPKCSYITPVPGGVGPMTRTALLLNTYQAATQEVYG